jgi:hypothetical protein
VARRNPLWFLVSALVLVGSIAASLFAVPTSAGAATFVPDHVVQVHPTYFEGPWGGRPGEPVTVYARPGETIEFKLADQSDTHHTVTLEERICDGRPDRLCERSFDVNPPVIWRFLNLGEYPFYDRYAREEGRQEMVGKFVITDSPPPVPPSTTTTTVPPSTTTTTRPVTTTTAPSTTSTAPSTTSTTAPTQLRPFLIPDPPSTTSTIPAVTVTSNTGTTAPAANKDKGKDKTKSKAAGSETATTLSPPPPDTMPPDALFDPAALTPGPSLVPDAPSGPDGNADVNLESSAVVDLLNHEEEEPTDYWPLLLALGGLALVLGIGGVCIWFGRPSRYYPA